MGETRILAEFIAQTSFGEIPADIETKAKEAITDMVGVSLYGSQHAVGDHVVSYVETMFPGEQATLLGGGTASPAGAALANGTVAHAVDYDDTFESIVIHPTGPVFSAALAMAESVGATGRDVLTAYVIGVETAYRTGQSVYPSHYDTGWHSTGTAGCFGAVAAAASLAALSATEIQHALGTVASQSSALKKNFGTMTKPLHPGHAAQMGVRATVLAESGFTADTAIFEGDIGYGAAMTVGDTYDPSEITAGLGDHWAVADIGYKPYPSGVITHAAMDALRNLLLEQQLDTDDIESVTVTLDPAASEMLHHESPETGLEAKFSIEFCLAAVLRDRDPGIHEFTDEYVTEAETETQMAKIYRDFQPDLFGGDFANYAARLSITTGDGTEFTTEERYAPGSPNNPISEERLRAKFHACAESVLSAEAATSVYQAIETLETEGALETLLAAANP